MMNIKHKTILYGFSALLAVTSISSCSKDDNMSVTEPNRYTANDVKSYADLFNVFWNTMDQRYNYFHEQKMKDGLDWDQVYKDYYPKFEALQTYGRSTDNDNDIKNDYEKAKLYFSEIIDPIIDRHFNVRIQFPITNSGIIYTSTFYGGMLTEEFSNTLPFAQKYTYMQSKVGSNVVKLNNIALGGRLLSNPDIYYFTFSQFNLASNFEIRLLDKYLAPDPGNQLVLTEQIIDNSEALNQIANPQIRAQVRDFTVGILNEWNKFPTSAEMVAFNNEIQPFKNTEVLSDQFLQITQNALTKSQNLVRYDQAATYSPVISAETVPYLNWFIAKMREHVTYGYNLPRFTRAAQQIFKSADFYQQFLNPLHKGEIKKLVLDLRNNGGGAVLDARFFSDRFITKEAVFSYQRTREGNGRFNYTPWVEAKTKAHQFGIPSNIPIVVLTDQGSASMSEITTLMLKSQGTTISVGGYSAGATAGLGTPDDFNGGTRDDIAGGKLTFYMPLLALKDATGEVVEGVGIKPDFLIPAISDTELSQLNSSPLSFVDRALDKAIEYLATK